MTVWGDENLRIVLLPFTFYIWNEAQFGDEMVELVVVFDNAVGRAVFVNVIHY